MIDSSIDDRLVHFLTLSDSLYIVFSQIYRKKFNNNITTLNDIAVTK